MKKALFFLTLITLPFIIKGQKHDNIWLFGYGSNDGDSIYGGTNLEFLDDTINTYYEYRDMWFDVTNTSMCDTAGNLLFYTNGVSIWNSVNEPLENGEGLNPGLYTQLHEQFGLIILQGVLALPKHDSDNHYYLFHMDLDYPIDSLDYHGKNVYYSLIDMSKNNGLGAVTLKNQIIINDILSHGRMTSCKHANGIDWWTLVKKYGTNTFYKIRQNGEGFEVSEQSIGELTHSNSIGQAVFSPDGTKYVRLQMVSMELGNFLNIYDFDRCTGELSNPIQITYADSAWSGGVAISPNSRFLYVSSYEYVYQFDLWADDIESTKDTVAIYDGWYYGDSQSLRSTFFLMQLGPNGKIYISANNSIPALHVINNPDLPGDSCDVCQHCVELPTYNAFSMPNFPNYRLGATEEPCLPDAVDEPESNLANVSVYPNPTHGDVIVEIDKEITLHQDSNFVLYDALGQEVYRTQLSSFKTEVSLYKMPKGIYFYSVEINRKVLGSGKLVIMN